ARRAQPRCDGGVVRRRPTLENLRSASGRHVSGGEHVLERQRDAGQRRRQRLTCGHGGVHPGSLGQRPFLRNVQKRVVLLVCLGDLIQARTGRLGGRHLLGGDPGAQRGRVEADQFTAVGSSRKPLIATHSASPRIRGTANRPSTAFGACASASSWVRHGSTRSARNTLTSLSGLPVGSTPVTSTAWIWLTWPRMASSWPA